MRLVSVLAALVFVGCASVGQDNTAEPEANTSATETTQIDWLQYAQQAKSISAFTTAVNNLILLEDNESLETLWLKPALFEPEPSSNRPARQKRQSAPLSEQFDYLSTSIGQICPSIKENDWQLLGILKNQPEQQTTMFYRIEDQDTGLHWCSLTVEKKTGGFKIIDLYNHYDEFGYTDLVDAFSRLHNKVDLNLSMSTFNEGGFYAALDGGFDTFEQYLDDHAIHKTQSAILGIRLRLADLLDDNKSRVSIETDLAQFISVPGLFAIRELLLSTKNASDDNLIQQKLTLAESITHDKSALRSLVAEQLYARQFDALATDMLRTAIIAEPTYDLPYLKLFDHYNRSAQYQKAVTVLQVLAENFRYRFDRAYFLKHDDYAELVSSPAFSQWLPTQP